MSRVVSGLAKRRLVVRDANSQDGRGVHLTLSKSGRKLYMGLIEAASQRDRAFRRCLTRDEKQAFEGRARQARRPGARLHPAGKKEMKTRITELLGIEHPIFQAAMSWASSSAPLVIAVSNAGGMGVIAAGPMRPDEFRSALKEIRKGTQKPYGVNIPLNNPRAAELLNIAYEARIPVMVASQGGPREHLARFRAIGTKWLHVVASVEHAKKAEAAGVDALVVDGAEAGGHPPPSEVGTLVLVRRVVKAVRASGWWRAAASPTAPASPRCLRLAPTRCSSARASSRARKRACTTTTSAPCSRQTCTRRRSSAAAGCRSAS
jgi:enoyl-[acyl-carrier protein] reductase II